MNSSSSRHVFYGIMIFVMMLVCIRQTTALRGCSSFGHSCFGAHGKRTDENISPSVKPAKIGDQSYHQFDFNNGKVDTRDYPTMDEKIQPVKDRHIPVAILKLLRNLAIEIDQSAAPSEQQ